MLISRYLPTFQSIVVLPYSGSNSLPGLLDPEDEGIRILWNFSYCLLINTAWNLRRLIFCTIWHFSSMFVSSCWELLTLLYSCWHFATWLFLLIFNVIVPKNTSINLSLFESQVYICFCFFFYLSVYPCCWINCNNLKR